MSDSSKLLGLPVERTIAGEDLKFSPATIAIRAKFTIWLERRAFERLRLHRSSMLPAEYNEALAAVTRDVAGGAYEWGRPAWALAVDSRTGIEHLALICLQEHHPEVTPEDVFGLAESDYAGLVEALMAAVDASSPKAMAARATA